MRPSALLLLASGFVGCGQPAVDVSTPQTVFDRDDRRLVDPSEGGALAAIGTIDSSLVRCTGTLIASNKVLSAAHCFENTPPDSFTFTRLGETDATRVTRVTQGRDPTDGEVSGDWAIVTLARSYGVAPMNRVIAGETAPLPVRVAGYSFDLGGRLGTHEDCQIVRVVDRTFLHDCDMRQGSSGGPMYRLVDGEAQVIGVQSGESCRPETDGCHRYPNGTSWSPNIPNFGASAESFAFAPDVAMGLAAAKTRDGRMQWFVSDRDWSLIATRWKTTADANSPSSAWQAFDSRHAGVTRLAAVNLEDGRIQVFAVKNTGELTSRWQLEDDWSEWQAHPTGRDFWTVAAAGGHGKRTHLCTLRMNGLVECARKTGDASSAWSDWTTIGTLRGATHLSAVRFADVTQVVVAVGGSLYSAWTTESGGWTQLSYFATVPEHAAATGLAATTVADGRAAVYVTRAGGVIERMVRAHDGSRWSDWEVVASGTLEFEALGLGQLTDGRLQAVAIADGELYTAWETSTANGGLTSFVRFYK